MATPSIRPVHLRRALLLFAIVLGLAAIATTVSRPLNESPEQAGRQPSGTEQETTPTAAPGDAAPEAAELVFDAELEQTRRLDTGQPATVLVEVDEPGQVEIPDLGLSALGDTLTPARFEIFASSAGRHEILFTPAAGDETGIAGSLVVEPPER